MLYINIYTNEHISKAMQLPRSTFDPDSEKSFWLLEMAIITFFLKIITNSLTLSSLGNSNPHTLPVTEKITFWQNRYSI